MLYFQLHYFQDCTIFTFDMQCQRIEFIFQKDWTWHLFSLQSHHMMLCMRLSCSVPLERMVECRQINTEHGGRGDGQSRCWMANGSIKNTGGEGWSTVTKKNLYDVLSWTNAMYHLWKVHNIELFCRLICIAKKNENIKLIIIQDFLRNQLI